MKLLSMNDFANDAFSSKKYYSWNHDEEIFIRNEICDTPPHKLSK